jgi:hypothetical protein
MLALTFTYILVSSAGAAVAIGRGLPAEWMGLLSSEGEIWVDFLIGGGTALSPPVVSLVLIAAAAVGSFRTDRTGRMATLLLAALVALNVIGALGEPITWRSIAPDTFDLQAASISILMTVSPALLAVVAVAEYRARGR